MALQTADGCHGVGQLFEDLVDRQVAGIMGPQGAGQPEADVGRAGAHGQAVLMGDLIVVGRQPGGFGVDKGREIAPGPPGDFPEKTAVRFRQRSCPLLRGRSQVQKPTEQRREHPQEEPGGGLRQAGRHQKPDRHTGGGAEEAPQGQAGDEERLPASGAPMGGLGRPLQETAPGDQAAVADPGDGIQAHRGLVRQQRGVGRRPQQVVPQLRRGEILPPFAGGGHGEGLRQRVKEELHADDQGGDPADPRGNEPGGQQQSETRGREQTAAQVVEDLPAAQQGEGVRLPGRPKPGERGEKSTPRSASRRESSDGPGWL